MSSRPGVDAGPSPFRIRPDGPLPPGLERVIAEVRAGAPEYRRWWLDGHGSGPSRPGTDSPDPPWSEADEERAARVAAAGPWWVRSVADELERAHTDLREVAAHLDRLAGSAIGTAASARCAQLAAAGHERACEAAVLAAGARRAGDGAQDVLDTAARRLSEMLDGDSARWQAPGRPPWREPPGAGWQEPPGAGGQAEGAAEGLSGGYFEGYAAILRAVRTELNSALEALEALVGSPPGTWPAIDRPSGHTVQAPQWPPEPGNGPLLPGTEARRVETDVGVRIARLPDGSHR